MLTGSKNYVKSLEAMLLNNTHGNFTHPEVFFDVFAEFQRLHAREPNVDGSVKWAMARDLAWTLALADTALLKQQLGLK